MTIAVKDAGSRTASRFGTGTVADHRSPPLWRRALGSAGIGYGFIAPALVIYVGVILLPILQGIRFAFTDWNGLDRVVHYVGLSNFLRMFNDIQVRSALGTT